MALGLPHSPAIMNVSFSYPMIDDYGISVHLLWFTLEVYDATLIGL